MKKTIIFSLLILLGIAPLMAEEPVLSNAGARAIIDCADTSYIAVLSVTCSDVPRTVTVTSDLFSGSKNISVISSTMEFTVARHDKEAVGTQHWVKVTTTGLPSPLEATFTVPAADCVDSVELGEVCVDQEASKTVTASVEGISYAWKNDDRTISNNNKSYTFKTEVGDHTILAETYIAVPDSQNRLMAGGDFEGDRSSFQSDYQYVANTHEYYSSHSGANNLYTITNDANYFWHDYNTLPPHSGNKYALFDAGKSGDAWRTNTTINPLLKIIKGAIYSFSYWAVCPNKTVQSAAILQFVIKYKDEQGQTQTTNLGNAYMVRSSTWTYQEVKWTAPATSDWIEISVTDKNTAAQGNDFCLDDIMFQIMVGQDLQLVKRDYFTYFGKNCGCDGIPVYRKWNDVLFVDNSKNEYQSYVWYVDSVAVPNSNSQYYRFEGEQLEKEIYVEATKKDGTIDHSCASLISDAAIQQSAPLNPVSQQVVARRSYYVGPAMQIIQTTYGDGHTEVQKIIQ